MIENIENVISDEIIALPYHFKHTQLYIVIVVLKLMIKLNLNYINENPLKLIEKPPR